MTLVNTVSKLAESGIPSDRQVGNDNQNTTRDRISPAIGTNLSACNLGVLKKGDKVVMCLFYQSPTTWRILRGTTTIFTGTAANLPDGSSGINRTGGKIFTDVIPADGSYTYNLESNLNGGTLLTFGMTCIAIKKENSFAKRDGIIKN